MADWVGAALSERAVLAVEAGTGIGKTFAYLVPALLSGRHVIVSTGTRTLQDQLYHRDLPMLAKALGRPVRVALLKGRANYLCRHRLELAEQTRTLPGFASPSLKALKKVRKWAAVTRSGDVAELTGLRDNDPVLPAVTSTRENCLGAECAEYSRCHVALARREAQAADIVVVNHHLLLADLSLKEEGFGDLLPGTDAVILHEAHQVPHVAAQFFGLTVSSRQGGALARDALAEMARAGHTEAGLRQQLAAVEDGFAQALAAVRGGGERVEWDALPDAFIEALQEAQSSLEALAEGLANTGSDDSGLRQCTRRATSLADTLARLLAFDAEDGVRWVESSGRAFSANFSPFEVADRLRELMQARACAWIFTSATLAVGEDFGHFTGRVGAADARTLRVASPFDFERQALLYLPAGMPDPSDRKHTAAVVATALPLIEADPLRAWEVNATASVALMHLACDRVPGPFVFASTFATYGPGLPDPLPLDAPQWPQNVYGATKVAVERMGVYFAQKRGLDFRCLRFPQVLSPFAPPGAVTAYPGHAFRAAVEGHAFAFPVAPDTGASNLYLDDVIASFAALLRADRARLRQPAYNLHGYTVTAGEIAATLAELVPGFTATFAPDPVTDALIRGWPDRMDSTAAQDDWDWAPAFDFPRAAQAMLHRLRNT